MDDQIDWDDIFDDSFLDVNIDPSFPLPNSSPNDGNSPNNPSPLSVNDIEDLLMKDDDKDELNLGQEIPDAFFQDILLDSPLEGDRSGEVVDASDADNSASEQKNEDVVDKEETPNSDDDPNDPLAKKRKRQLRNKDAALRSRERKKMYVKDLEMKSRYFEGECKRLGSLLQCLVAENQALRFSLHSSKAYNVSMTKQESAVLLLESLLLGSLLWFLGTVCQLILPSPLQLNLGAAQPVTVVKEKLPNHPVLTKTGSEICRLQSLLVGKRFKASRSRMKNPSLGFLETPGNALAVF